MSTIIKCLSILPAVLAGWIAVMTGVMYVSDAAPAAVVMFPSEDFLSRLPADFSVLSRGAVTITLSTEIPDAGPRLYEAGALLVLPAGLTGCLPLQA